MFDKVQKHKEICDKLNDMYQKKNHDYGDAYSLLRRKYPESILIRIFDKFTRLETLKHNENEVKDENIKDTLLDLANYCIMEVIEIELIESSVLSHQNIDEVKEIFYDAAKDIVGDRIKQISGDKKIKI